MEMDQFMEIIENSDEFLICKPQAGLDVMYKATNELSAVVINNFLINPSKIGINGKSINIWVNSPSTDDNMSIEMLIGSFSDVRLVKTLKIV